MVEKLKQPNPLSKISSWFNKYGYMCSGLNTDTCSDGIEERFKCINHMQTL